jgi:hypothetical protein
MQLMQKNAKHYYSLLLLSYLSWTTADDVTITWMEKKKFLLGIIKSISSIRGNSYQYDHLKKNFY